MSKISPLAYIDPEARIGENCEIGPFCFIDKNVEIGDNNVLMNHVTVLYGARIGNGNTIFPGAVIGAVPQDLKFRGEETTAEIGDNNKIRENVTINRGTAAKGRTKVGSGNLLMESVHVAHDATLARRVHALQHNQQAMMRAFHAIGVYHGIVGPHDGTDEVLVGNGVAVQYGLALVGAALYGKGGEELVQS